MKPLNSLNMMCDYNIEIVGLDKKVMFESWSELVKIDERYVKNDMLEGWGESHFKFEAKDKWQLSVIAKINQKIVGYRIVSGLGKINNYSHSHRTSIKEEYKRKGIASLLLQKSIGKSLDFGYIGMTGLLNPKNQISRKFLINSNWKKTHEIYNGNELWALNF